MECTLCEGDEVTVVDDLGRKQRGLITSVGIGADPVYTVLIPGSCAEVRTTEEGVLARFGGR